MVAVKIFLVICTLACVALDLDAKKVPGGLTEKKEVPKPEKGKKEIAQHMFDVIYPGTKWCGPGNIAANYNDLGTLNTLDMCCRDHDNCPDQIPAYTYNATLNLLNIWPFTKLSCACDQALYNCLKNVNSSDSCAVGNMYFNNAVNPQPCFKEDYPQNGCKTNYPFPAILRCKEYYYLTNKPKKYQFFDSLRY